MIIRTMIYRIHHLKTSDNIQPCRIIRHGYHANIVGLRHTGKGVKRV